MKKMIWQTWTDSETPIEYRILKTNDSTRVGFAFQKGEFFIVLPESNQMRPSSADFTKPFKTIEELLEDEIVAPYKEELTEFAAIDLFTFDKSMWDGIGE